MNVLVVAPQTSSYRGPELTAARMAKWALRMGHKALLVASAFHDWDPVVSERDLARSLSGYISFERDPKAGVPSARALSFKSTIPVRRVTMRDFFSVLRALDEELGVDLLVVHSTFWNGPEEAARWAKWKLELASIGERVRPTVFAYMPHYRPLEPGLGPVERTLRLAWNATALPQVLKSADLVLCASPLECDDLTSMGADRNKAVHYRGLLDDDFASLVDSARPDLIRERLRVREDYIVSYVGPLEPRKNVTAVLQTARRLEGRGVAFVVAGGGEEAERLRREASRLSNVYFAGLLSEEEKASLIKASLANIILSRAEGLGVAQIEFMYGGVPVITSASYGQRWLVRDGVDGMHVRGPDDIEGAAKAVEALKRDAALRESLGRNARERARGFLMSEGLVQLLNQAGR
ncbi:MAG: glycosyltransferase [Thermoproteus sp.]